MATGGLGVHDPVSVERRRICGRSGTEDCGSGHQSDGAHTIADHGSLLSSLVASIWPLTNPSLYAFFQPIAVASAQQLIQIFQMPNSNGKRQTYAGDRPTGALYDSEPVRIESTSLELREKDKVATFIGNVNLIQGDTTLRCKTLVIYYEEMGKPSGMKTAQSTPGGEQQQIRRVEAGDGVVVTQKDQIATGENGLFDTAAKTPSGPFPCLDRFCHPIVVPHRFIIQLWVPQFRVRS
jgi:LptA/(LptD N-terminal domain) LPS transport protein